MAIKLAFELQGPTPWVANGTATFKILFFSIDVKFSHTWGERREDTLPDITVLPKVIEALEQSRNWIGELPANRFLLTTIKTINLPEDIVLMHNIGTLTVRQTVIPVGLNLDKFGNYTPADINKIDFTEISINNESVEYDLVKDAFAPAEFIEMSDADKLSSPSYKDEHSGLKAKATEKLLMNYGINRIVNYELRISDYDRSSDIPYLLYQPLLKPFSNVNKNLFKKMVKGGAIGKSELSKKLKENAFLNTNSVELKTESFTVANVDTLDRVELNGFTGGSKAEADSYLKTLLITRPELKGKSKLYLSMNWSKMKYYAETLAHYGFIPWLRQGVATKITEKDTLGVGSGTEIERAKIEVSVTLRDTEIGDASTNDHTITKEVSLYGPGDIIAVSDRAIVKTEPRKHVRNFEPNLLPYIEFYEEDFPWRFTPAKSSNSGVNRKKLRPWIALIVLKEDEFTLNPSTEGLASITIKDEKINSAFYSHKETWAWAHVHLNTDFDNSTIENLTNEVSQELETDPDSGISRIICPRKLQKSTSYHAFLLPTFETGRLAGLNEATEGIPAQEPAWRQTGNSISTSDIRKNTFPFYHYWEFGTGELGDFESLVSALKPIITKEDTGKLQMDIQDPGFNLQSVASSETIGVEGALKPPGMESDKFPNGSGDTEFQNKVKEILNLNVNYTKQNQTDGKENPFYSAPLVEDPMVVPHIYGFWHATINEIGLPSNPKWINSLNLDPKNRGVAGLGTTVVQKNQEDYMHRAWKQVGDIKEANQKIKETQVTKLVGSSIFKKHLKNANGSTFTAITHSTHKRVRSNTLGTVNKVFKESKVPIVAKSPAFRKLIRPGKKSNRIVNKTSLQSLHHLTVTNFNKESETAVTAAKVKVSPDSAITFQSVNDSISLLKREYRDNKFYLAKDLIFDAIHKENLNTISSLTKLKNNIDANPIGKAQARNLAKQGIDNLIKSTYSRVGDLITVKMQAAKFKEIFGEGGAKENVPTTKIYKNVTLTRDLDSGEQEWESKSTNLGEINHFGTAIEGLVNKTSQDNYAIPVEKQAIGNLKNVFDDIKLKLNPKRTLDQKLRHRISLFANTSIPIQPIMAHPKYDEPVYEEVKKISQDFILPNVEKLKNNSITIMQTNQKFIESYMVGMNHEMARELLWREFPTDQRGSCFRQFWDIKDDIFQTDREKQYDIDQIHKWREELGNHSMKPGVDSYLVLVVRGQLLLKYPNTLVYAQKAEYDSVDPTLERKLPDSITESNTKFPVFSARLEPDIFLFGFDLTIDAAKGQRAVSPSNTVGMDAGWFFAFKERPGEIKFGLDDYFDDLGNSGMPNDDAENWDDLTWEHLVDQSEDLNSYFINFNKAIDIQVPVAGQPNPVWGENSADLAHILYQNPVIFARHAQEMLPED